MENLRSNRPIIFGATALAVVLVIGLIVWFVVGRGSSGSSASSSDSVSDNSSSHDYGVVAGAGGARVAADGVTGLGYEDTCKGAVEAAASFASLLTSRDLHAAENIATTVDEISADAGFAKEQKDYITMAVLTQGMSKDELNKVSELRDTFHPNWSGKYLVRECVPGERAVVAITGILESVNTVDNQTQKNYGYSTATYELVWKDNDWKAQSYIENYDSQKNPVLTEGVPEPTKSDTTVASWKDDHFDIKVEQQERVVMDSTAFEQAFSGVTPDITQWYNFSEGN